MRVFEVRATNVFNFDQTWVTSFPYGTDFKDGEEITVIVIHKKWKIYYLKDRVSSWIDETKSYQFLLDNRDLVGKDGLGMLNIAQITV